MKYLLALCSWGAVWMFYGLSAACANVRSLIAFMENTPHKWGSAKVISGALRPCTLTWRAGGRSSDPNDPAGGGEELCKQMEKEPSSWSGRRPCSSAPAARQEFQSDVEREAHVPSGVTFPRPHVNSEVSPDQAWPFASMRRGNILGFYDNGLIWTSSSPRALAASPSLCDSSPSENKTVSSFSPSGTKTWERNWRRRSASTTQKQAELI